MDQGFWIFIVFGSFTYLYITLPIPTSPFPTCPKNKVWGGRLGHSFKYRQVLELIATLKKNRKRIIYTNNASELYSLIYNGWNFLQIQSIQYIYVDIFCLSTINLCSSNLFFLIGVPKLTYRLLVHLLVLHYLFQCLLLGYCSHQIKMLREIWCRFQARCFKVLCFLDSSVELLLVMRMSLAPWLY